MESVIAIDLGGTKLSSAIVDETGQVSNRRKVAVTRGSVGACLDQIAEAVTHITGNLCRDEIRAVAILVPGIYFAGTGNVWAPNLWGHEQVPLREELRKRLRLPVVIDNDRMGYVAGEQWMGVAKGLKDVVFLSVGTGIGAGILADGRLLRGSTGIAGAAGWFALGSDFKEIYRQLGCWEAEAAGPALAHRLQRASAEEVVAAARRSDREAQNAIEKTARYLGIGIANIVSLLNPEMVVLGGGLMQAADLFLDTIERSMVEWAQPLAARHVRIAVTQLGEDAGLMGAARLAFDTHF
jgi:glucokinase